MNTIEVVRDSFVEQLASRRLTFVGVSDDGVYNLYSDLGIPDLWKIFLDDYGQEIDAIVSTDIEALWPD